MSWTNSSVQREPWGASLSLCLLFASGEERARLLLSPALRWNNKTGAQKRNSILIYSFLWLFSSLSAKLEGGGRSRQALWIIPVIFNLGLIVPLFYIITLFKKIGARFSLWRRVAGSAGTVFSGSLLATFEKEKRDENCKNSLHIFILKRVIFLKFMFFRKSWNEEGTKTDTCSQTTQANIKQEEQTQICVSLESIVDSCCLWQLWVP